jgi:hypothetical protein
MPVGRAIVALLGMKPRSRIKLAVGAFLTIALGVGAWLARAGWSSTPPDARVAAPESMQTDIPRGSMTELEAPERGSGRSQAAASIPSGAEPSNAASAAASSTRLYGFVRPPVGRSTLVAACNVRVTDRFAVSTSARTNESGAYSMPGLAPGRYWLAVRSLENGEAALVLDLDGTQREQRVDLQLVLPTEILIRAVDEAGRALSEDALLAVATADPPGEWLDEVRGSFNNPFGVGQFWENGYAGRELPEGFIGRVLLEVEPPVYVSLLHCQRVIATQRVDIGQSEVEFVIARDSKLLAPGSLRVRFVDRQSHEPVENATVHLTCNSTRLLPPSTGEIVALELEPGLYELQLAAPGYESRDQLVRIEAGVETNLGDVPVERESFISGRVVDRNGAGVATELTLRVIDPTTGRPFATRVRRSLRSAADGSFSIGRLSRAVYFLEVGGANSQWATKMRLIDVTTAHVDALRIEVEEGLPLVVTPSDERWPLVGFRVIDVAGALVHAGRLRSAAPQRLLLARGVYTLEVTVGKMAPQLRSIVMANEPVSVSLP